ncbi:hypothetical protein Tco_1452057, partial [Tanacetum coccineum]
MSVVKSPCRLAPFKMEELSSKLRELQDKGVIRPSSSPLGAPEEKIKDSKILIDELDPLPGSSDFLPFPEYDLVFYEDFSE